MAVFQILRHQNTLFFGSFWEIAVENIELNFPTHDSLLLFHTALCPFARDLAGFVPFLCLLAHDGPAEQTA